MKATRKSPSAAPPANASRRNWLAGASGAGAALTLGLSSPPARAQRLSTPARIAIAGGGLAGGMLLDGYGAASFPWAMLALLLVALTIAWCAHRHSFKPGRRSGGAVLGH